MGQLSTALKATKELRKQFTKQKPVKKLSKRHQRIQDLIYDKDFGCSKDSVAELIGALEGVSLHKKDDSNEKFKQIRGSLLFFLKDGDLAVDDGSGTYIEWADPKNGNHCSMDRRKDRFRPATDKEIREYFS